MLLSMPFTRVYQHILRSHNRLSQADAIGVAAISSLRDSLAGLIASCKPDRRACNGHPPISGFIDNAFRSNPFVFRSGGSCQKPAAEPAANGLIIELQAGVGDGDSSDQQ